MKNITFMATLLLAVTSLTGCEQPKADASGVFEARTVTISPEESGRIISLDVKEGDIVSEGQQLILIDTVPLSIQRRQLLAARHALGTSSVNADVQTSAIAEEIAQLEREKKRVENLLAVGAATRVQKEQLESKIAALRNQIKAAAETIGNTNNVTDGNKDVNTVQIEAIDERLSRCHVKSPLAGTVISTYYEKGEMALAGHPLLKISNHNDVWLTAYFPGSRMADIRIGQKVKVNTLYGGESEMTYDGTITWIASESQFTPKSLPSSDERANMVYAVKVAVKNDGKIRPGLSGEVWLK